MSLNGWIGFIFRSPNRYGYDVVFYSISLMLFYQAMQRVPWWLNLIFLILGIFSWLLFEYLIHRFLFHFRAQTIVMRKAVYAVHGVHHKNTRDKNRFYVPLIPALAIAYVLFSAFYCLLDQLTYGFFVGAFSMHQIYNYVHLMIHNERPLKSHYLNKMRAHHFEHHYQNGRKCFGVTTRFFDRLFRTL